LKPNEDKSLLVKLACKKLRLDTKNVISWEIVKESLDARNKKNIFFIYTINLEVSNQKKILNIIKNKDVSLAETTEYTLPTGEIKDCKKPIVVGFGPAGMFAALALCRLGFKPIVFERGEEVEKRSKIVEEFWEKGILNEKTNVQFGEGGAGTFSDGKLTARTKDKKSDFVFRELVKAGAPAEILYSHNPHIGTDKLRAVVKNIREEIIKCGGEINFNSQVTSMNMENNKIVSLEINGETTVECEDVILSVGHSARDTFEMIYNKGVTINQKPFAVGCRIEHLQKDINVMQFGEFAEEENLGAAEYKVVAKTKDQRSVYTFCMCPGGHVVAAASEKGRLCVNGMSYHARDGKNANSAILVEVNTSDFGSNNPLAGMHFQRELEEKAFNLGGGDYTAPAQRLGDFLGVQYNPMVEATYKPAVNFVDISEIFPTFITNALKEGIVEMGKKLRGFDAPDSILTAVE
ncbi:MAG: NAD(P)/FAD-dependent oxidoreductase, partial [Anaerotignaceae bacterium]